MRIVNARGKPNRRKNGCTVLALCAITAAALPAQTLTTLHSFCSAIGDGCPDGQNPRAGLVQATDGDLYGTTEFGGAGLAGVFGTIFKITPGGALTTLQSFGGATEGIYPYAGLIQAANGNLYGTTSQGGANGGGTIFEIGLAGALTTVNSFGLGHGSQPWAGLVQTADGDFYGTTTKGGIYYYGAVFKLSATGALTTLHSFCSQGPPCPDGAAPQAGLIQGADGALYGTTNQGGAKPCPKLGCGTVFKITPAGDFTTLHSFSWSDGGAPGASLVQAPDGYFYGTTSDGTTGGGTVFKITPSGALTTLYTFCSVDGCVDGGGPGGLIRTAEGLLYGMTNGGGAHGGGTIFKIAPGGALTTVYSFCSQSGCADGSAPGGPLVQAADGSFYGTTFSGGTSRTCGSGCGTVFRLSGGPG